jgi:hypothetical protein
VQLAQPLLGEDLGDRVDDLLLGEHDRRLDVVGVARHRRQIGSGLDQEPRELACPVRPEVEEDERVPLEVDRRRALEDDRLDELVGDAGVVARLHGFQ